MQRLIEKFSVAILRLTYFLKTFPLRLQRLLLHFWNGLKALQPDTNYWWQSYFNVERLKGVGVWWAALPLYILDLIAFGEVYEFLFDFVKFNTRGLKDWEIKMAKEVYGDSINYALVRLDEKALLGPKQQHFAYVNHHTINCYGTLQNSTIIHELIHVWQYERFGSVYMLKAILAQRSKMGYNYGGISALKAALNKGTKFTDFNFEQQGDIIADFYRLKNGYKPHWGKGKRSDAPVYEEYVNQMRKG